MLLVLSAEQHMWYPG